MKPCRSFRQSVALHAAKALEPSETRAVRQHLAECPACREYFRAMQAVCSEHQKTEGPLAPRNPLPEPLLLRVSEQMKSSENQSACAVPAPLPAAFWLPRLAWSFAALTVAALLWRQFDTRKPSAPEPALPAVAAQSTDAPSSHMAYRLALNQSFEQLDRALAKSTDDAAASPARSLYQSRLDLAKNGL